MVIFQSFKAPYKLKTERTYEFGYRGAYGAQVT